METCDPKDIVLKSFFLGPHAENSDAVRKNVLEILEHWFTWRRNLFPEDGPAISAEDLKKSYPAGTQHNLQSNVRSLLKLYEREVPKFSPRYIGHMFSEISLPALLGHIVTLLHNPNNISGETSKAGLKIEIEAIEHLAKMLGYTTGRSKGHFTSGGTVANFEGLLRARERLANWLALGAWGHQQNLVDLGLMRAAHMGWDYFEQFKSKFFETEKDYLQATLPYHLNRSNLLNASQSLSQAFDQDVRGPVVLIPENKHYSWLKGTYLLGLGEEALWPIALDAHGRMSVSSLTHLIETALLKNRPIMMVVSVAGSTELGGVDPIFEVSELLEDYQRREGLSLWHHVDAAYGGFFCSMEGLEGSPLKPKVHQDLKAIALADSVTLDPHKLGYVPYACGAFLTREKRDYNLKSFGAPYVDFPEDKDHGLYTLEGSRSAAGATATWMTGKCIGFDKDGTGRILARTIALKQKMEELMKSSGLPLRVVPHTDSNVLCFAAAHTGEPLTLSNERAEEIYQSLHPCGDGPFFVSKTTLYSSSYRDLMINFTATWDAHRDTDKLTLIRICLMNPFWKTRESRVDYMGQFIQELVHLM